MSEDFLAMEPVRVGIIGLGRNGMDHLRAHLELAESRVVAICDRNRELAAEVAREFSIPRYYTDDSFFEDPGLEAVSVNTGDHDHRLPFLNAVGAGKHVLVEKPVANTEEDVREMVAAADRADPRLKMQVGYILRFNPVFEEIRRLVASGALGRVYYMECDYIHNLLYQAAQTDPVTGHNWYLDHEIPIVGGGSHCLDLLRWFSGKEVTKVQGYGNHVAFPAMKSDDCQVCLFRFEDGTVAKVAALYAPRVAMAPFYNLRIYGTRGTIERDAVALSSSEEDFHPAFAPLNTQRLAGHPYEPEIRDWLTAIREGRPARVTLRDGANSTMTALCAARALRENREIEVPSFREAGETT
jgi:UDP-N-acetyl-2-amino-2-deoxyglucuronate dehydrogenase